MKATTRRIRRKRTGWQELKLCEVTDDDMAQAVRDLMHSEQLTHAAAFAAVENSIGDGEVWRNDTYQVVRSKHKPLAEGMPTLIHLSVRRRDRRTVREWDDLQRIKNQLIGARCEAVELYPTEERRVVDNNQHHLWGFDSTDFKFPFGFDEAATT